MLLEMLHKTQPLQSKQEKSLECNLMKCCGRKLQRFSSIYNKYFTSITWRKEHKDPVEQMKRLANNLRNSFKEKEKEICLGVFSEM